MVAIALAQAVTVLAQTISSLDEILFIDTIIPTIFPTSRTPGNSYVSISLKASETGIAIGILVAIAFAHTIAGSSIARRVQGFIATQ